MKITPGIWLFFCFLFSCQKEEATLFELVPASESGIEFANLLHEDEHYNLYDYEYFFNGGGVGIIDINNDGLQDIFLGGNRVSSRLYLNQGNFKFKDITEEAGLTTTVWIAGIAVVDLNNDGWQDLYLSVAGNDKVDDTSNLLFINNGNQTFTEQGAAYGINDTALTTQSAFFDYDVDGDLDLYLLNFGNVKWAKERLYPKIVDGSGPGADKLYQNNGDGTFTEVTKEAGILVEGYGLGVSILDVNQDNYPDIFVANDYLDDDVLYVNNGHGGFEDQLAKYLKHTSYFSMGCDAADINNDGLTDLMVLDMLPEKNERHKTLIGAFSYEKVNLRIKEGYYPAHVRNMLQLNNGQGFFSEIGRLSGIAATDWSWAPLLADFDNDGFRDLFVTNGYKKEVSNMDILLTMNFGSFPMGDEKAMEAFAKKQRAKFLKVVEDLNENRIVNYCFRNNGDLTFTNSNQAWGIHQKSFSNGAVYTDLDLDGDLDLVINNVDDPAFVYRNNTNQMHPDNHFLRVRLLQGNWPAQSAKVMLYYGNKKQQFAEFSPYRGYQSSVENELHFGLGLHDKIDSLVIQWPDGQSKKLTNITVNRTIEIDHKATQFVKRPLQQVNKLFTENSQAPLSTYSHKENYFIDFKSNPLLPHLLSRGGPALACGDLNGDGSDDLIIGGSKKQNTTLFLSNKETLSKQDISKPFPFEDLGLGLLDFDQDGDLDCYVASGGSESFAGSMDYSDRLYENNGTGQFQLTNNVIPAGINTSTSVVSSADYDKDGFPDLFVGGWVVPDNYPLPGPSYLLKNVNGRFQNISNQVSGLRDLGLVKAAVWTDIDQDGWLDLLVTGEWMSIKLFKNQQGTLIDQTADYQLDAHVGWWNSILPGDFDNDGDMDYIIGNLGLNTRYQASPEKPATLLAADIDQNGSIDPVIFCFEDEEQYPVHDRDELVTRVSSLKKDFFTYREYALAGINEFVKPDQQTKVYRKRATTFESILLRNDQGHFTTIALPIQAQMAPIYGTLALDLNEDAYLDLILIGNAYTSAISEGNYDATNGLVLLGQGDGHFKVEKMTGFYVPGDGKALVGMVRKQGLEIIATQNNDALKIFDFAKDNIQKVKADDCLVTLHFKNGSNRRVEVNHSGGYLSQGAGFFTYPKEFISGITIKNEHGDERKIQ